FAQSNPVRVKQPRPIHTQPGHTDTLTDVIDKLLGLNPLPPEGRTQTKSGEDTASEREEKPPDDNAPMKELIDFWARHFPEREGDLKPSDKVRERFLDAVEDRPEDANSLLGLMPDSPSAHDRLYKLLQDEVYEEGSTWRETLHDWLKHNSRYFLDELVESVRSLSDAGSSLQSLARLDWDQARPLVESLATANRPDL